MKRLSAAQLRHNDPEAGQGLVEYLMLIALVAIGLMSVLSLLFDQVGLFYQAAAAALQTMMPR